MERGNRSVQYVVHTIVETCLFDRCDVGRFLDHTNQPLVTGGVGAIAARIHVSDVVADGTEVKFFLEIANRGSKGLRVVFTGPQYVKGKPLSAFSSHARQLLQFFNELSHWLGEL